MVWFPYRWALKPNVDPRLNGLIVDISNPNLKEYSSTLECVIDAVHQIANENPEPYTLLVSGGIDSQAMIYAWMVSGIPFKIVHYSYNAYNSHDTINLLKYLDQFSLPAEIHNFDAISFIQSPELINYAKKYDCSSPQLLTYVKMVEKHPETVIMSGNTFNGKTVGVNYTHLVLDRFSRMVKKNFVPFFFASNPSITYLSKYLHDRVDPVSTPDIYYFFKKHIYDSFGANVILQNGPKTGFEKIKDLCDIYEIPLHLKYKYKNRSSKRPFDILYRYELYQHIGFYSEITKTIPYKE